MKLAINQFFRLMTDPKLRVIDSLKILFFLTTKKSVLIRPIGITHPVLIEKRSDFSMLNNIVRKDSYGFDYPGEPKAIIDAGANIGFAAIYFASKYPNAKVCAIENLRNIISSACSSAAKPIRTSPALMGVFVDMIDALKFKIRMRKCTRSKSLIQLRMMPTAFLVTHCQR
jgi:hypothetical protein